MTSQQIDNRTQRLEKRVAALETELTQLKQLLTHAPMGKRPWWEEVAGSFESDPTFDEAVRIGQEWRRSAE